MYDDNDSFCFESSDDEPRPDGRPSKNIDIAIMNSGRLSNFSQDSSDPHTKPRARQQPIPQDSNVNYGSTCGVLNPIEEESNVTESRTNLVSSIPHKNKILKNDSLKKFDPGRNFLNQNRFPHPDTTPPPAGFQFNPDDLYDSEFIKLEKTLNDSKRSSNHASQRGLPEVRDNQSGFMKRPSRAEEYRRGSRDGSLGQHGRNGYDVEGGSIGKGSRRAGGGGGGSGKSDGNRLAFVAGQNLIANRFG